MSTFETPCGTLGLRGALRTEQQCLPLSFFFFPKFVFPFNEGHFRTPPQSLLNLLQYCFCFMFCFLGFFFWLQGMWDLSSPTRDQTHTRCIRRESLNHWTTREVPAPQFFPLQNQQTVISLSEGIKYPTVLSFVLVPECSMMDPLWAVGL